MNAARKTKSGGRPPVMHRCPYCREKFSARDVRTHKPICPARSK